MENKITTMEGGMQCRTELLLGKDNLEKIQSARVLIFGVGGVGSWCAEGLVRSGVRNITIVDSDRVCVSNCNRQLMATSRTIGEVKVDALRRDPFMIRKTEFWKVDGDPLARCLRKRFKKNKTFPRRKFMCVYSEEKPMQNMGDQRLVEHEWCSTKAQINGSLCHITASFGMAMAGIVINHIID